MHLVGERSSDLVCGTTVCLHRRVGGFSETPDSAMIKAASGCDFSALVIVACSSFSAKSMSACGGK